MKEGDVLELAKSPDAEATAHLAKLQAGDTTALARVEALARDETFARKFSVGGGIALLKKIVQTMKSATEVESRGSALSAYNLLMRHGRAIVDKSWDLEDSAWIKVCMNFCTTTSGMDPALLVPALKILAAYVRGAQAGFTLVKQEMGIQKIVPHIGSQNAGVQEAGVMLINAILSQCPSSQQKLHYVRQLRAKDVVGALGKRLAQYTDAADPHPVPSSFGHELYVLQTYCFSEEDLRASISYTSSDSGHEAQLKHLVEAFKKTGRPGDPTTELGLTPGTAGAADFAKRPGMVTLDCLAFLAATYPMLFKTLVLEQAGRTEATGCPLVPAAVATVLRLFELLSVGAEPSAGSMAFLTLFYSTKQPFKELFCVAMELLNSFWRDMGAKRQDLNKVLTMVGKALQVVLGHPSLRSDLRTFKVAVSSQSYQSLLAAEKELTAVNFERQLMTKSIYSYKENERNLCTNVVREQRISQMMRGAWFQTEASFSKKTSQTRFFAMLSANRKTLQWSQPTDAPSPERLSSPQLTRSIEIEDIRQWEQGREVPALQKEKANKHVDDKKERLIFAVHIDQEEWLTFVAGDRHTSASWMDGIRVLRNEQCREPETEADISQLLDLRMNVLMLNVHDVQLGDTGRPPVPPPPVGPFLF